jgi:hypothetical protein
VQERLIGYEEPTKEDIAAIKEYEAAKKKWNANFGAFERFDKRNLVLDQTFFKAIFCLLLARYEALFDNTTKSKIVFGT